MGIVIGPNVVDISDLSPIAPGAWPPVAMVSLIAAFDQLKPDLEQLARSRAGQPLASVHSVPDTVAHQDCGFSRELPRARGRDGGSGLISKFKADGQRFSLRRIQVWSGPADPIVLPKIEVGEIHHECELAIVIGKKGRDIGRHEALAHVFGYSCLLDIVVRGNRSVSCASRTRSARSARGS